MAKPGRKPIPPDLVAQVRRSYERTQSMRLTADETGLSRTSVQNIVRDRHLKVKSQSQMPRTAPGEVYVVPVRCPQGHLVEILPCRICHAALEKIVARRDELRQLERESFARASGQGSVASGQGSACATAVSAVRATAVSAVRATAVSAVPEPATLGFDLAPEHAAAFEQIRRRAISG